MGDTPLDMILFELWSAVTDLTTVVGDLASENGQVSDPRLVAVEQSLSEVRKAITAVRAARLSRHNSPRLDNAGERS